MNDNVNKDNNNEQFILEYPENYEEICEMALKKLDFDYVSVLKSEIKENSENKEKINVKEPNSNEEEEEEEQLIGEENKKSQYVQLDEEVEDFQKEVIQEQDTIITEVKQNEEKKEENINNSTNDNKSNNIIKNPEKIKEMINRIKYPTPKWAEHLSDEDFISKIKQIEIEK